MANVLSTDKKIAIVGALAEGNSRSIDPATSPVNAVRAAILQEYRDAQTA